MRMIKAMIYSVCAIAILVTCESGLFDVPIWIRLTAIVFYFPLILAVVRIVMMVLCNAIYPIIEKVEDYFDGREDRYLEKKNGFK